MKKISFLEKYLNELHDYLGEETYIGDFNSGTISPEDDMKPTTGNSDYYMGTKKNDENRQKIIENIIKGVNDLTSIITTIKSAPNKNFESITEFNEFLNTNGIQPDKNSIDKNTNPDELLKNMKDALFAVKNELGDNDLTSVLKAANESVKNTNENNKEQTSETSAPNSNEVASNNTTATPAPALSATPAASNNKV